MRRLVPEFIQQQYAAGEVAGSFEACALFVDISGFTVITDAIMGHGQHGSEILAGIIRDVFDPLVQSVFEQGGFVTNFAGDAFTAVFQATVEPVGEFRHAMAAAWQMQREMASSARHLTPYGTFTLSVKVGLAAGEVAWGIVSSADKRRSAYYFQGPAIDGCANAQKLAEAGAIVVDAAVAGALGSTVSTEPMEDHFRITAINGSLPAAQPVRLGAVNPEIVGRFYPPEATQEDLSGEFRQVTNMFVSLPTVQTSEQLQIFMQMIFELQDRYGGLLNRLDFGDKGANLLLFWGAPVAHENDVTRALSFILDLQSQTVIPVIAGITYGIAHGGYSGGELAGEYTCHGRGTTLAARLMQSCPRGEVWVDEHVAARAEQYFEFDFEEEMAFKGFSQEQKVFVLLERKEEIESFYEGQMVGRQVEQKRLADFVHPIWQGRHPGMMAIWGEPGIGKSRLISAFLGELEKAAKDEFSVFVCQCDEILRESLNPFRYWLRRYFGQSEQQSVARNKRSFSRKLDRLITKAEDRNLMVELDRTRSFLGTLVNLHWPDSLYEQLDAQGRYENTFTGLLTLLQLESLQQPIVLLLEDAHWLDDDSRAFLTVLTQELAQDKAYPIAILATARPEGDRALLGAEVDYQDITLDQISPADQEQLAADQLGSPIGPDLLELLVERAEGNPFFTEQVLRYLREQELLLLVGGKWHLRAEQELALPSDVRAVLVARLDRLTQEVKDVVQTASVLGREFEVKLLARMLHDDSKLAEKVVQAEDMAIWLALNEIRYLFKHALLRDAAYRMQLRSRRQSLHGLALEAMESLHEDDLEPHYGQLAYHAEQALMADNARRYLELAGNIARDAFQNSMAIDYYTRALKLTPDVELEGRFRLVSARMKLHHRLGARSNHVQDLNEMADLAGQMEDVGKQVKVQIERAWMFWWTADYAKALTVSQEASSMATAAGMHDLAAQADNVSTWAMIQREAYVNAQRLAEKGLVSARRSGDRLLESNALYSLAFIYRAEGDYFAALEAAEQALAVDQQADDQYGQGTALGNLGVANMSLGNYAGAKDCFVRALAIHREAGSKARTGSELVNLSWNAQTLGEWESAIVYGEEGIAILRAVNQAEMTAEG
ncbi:MAG: AAA family ATPase, partial [Chloroflexota bacterium]